MYTSPVDSSMIALSTIAIVRRQNRLEVQDVRDLAAAVTGVEHETLAEYSIKELDVVLRALREVYGYNKQRLEF